MNTPNFFTFLFLAVFASSVAGQSHNITWGTIGPYDRNLDHNIVERKSKLGRKVIAEYYFPKPGFYNNINITAIRCTDQYKNGKGGYASLLNGGIGYKYVTIHLKSLRGQGFNFAVEIFGR